MLSVEPDVAPLGFRPIRDVAGRRDVGRGRSDEELLEAARGDAAAFEEFYRRHFETIVRFVARRAPDSQAVADLVAAVWLEVIASLDRFDPARGPGVPWMLGVAANLCASERRRRVREREAIRQLAGRRVLTDDDVARLEEELDAVAAGRRLRQELSRLPPLERVAAELVLVDGLTPGEMAAALGISPPTARMRLARARQKLRSRLNLSSRTPLSQEVLR